MKEAPSDKANKRLTSMLSLEVLIRLKDLKEN